jgi:hypothetical protein
VRLSAIGSQRVVSGSILRQRVLGETAVYRVLAARGQVVEAEALAVPGLPPGTPVRLTAAAATAMRAEHAVGRERSAPEIRLPTRHAARALPRA